MKNSFFLLIMAFCFSTTFSMAQEVALKLKKPLSESDFKRVQSILRNFDSNSYKLMADVRTRKGLQTARLGNQKLKMASPATRDVAKNSRNSKIQTNRGLANVKQTNSPKYT